MSNFVRMLKASVIVFTTDAKHLFKLNVDDFKFNFLLRGQLGSLNLNRIFLPLFKILPC